jgi:4-hydroxybenzoate polyprenyltransferase
MAWQTSILFSFHPPLALFGFIFSGTMASYNFHWLLTADPVVPSERMSWNVHNKKLHASLTIAALLFAAFFSFFLVRHFLLLALTGFLTFLYSAPKIPFPAFRFLKTIAIGKTFFLALAWTHVTVLLPLLISGYHLETVSMLFLLNRFLFIYAICIIFDFRDREADRREQIRSLVTVLSEQSINRLFWSCIIVFFITSTMLFQYQEPWEVVLLTLPAIPLSLLFNYFKRHRSDYLYYFVLDGIMILSAAMLVLAKFAR